MNTEQNSNSSPAQDVDTVAEQNAKDKPSVRSIRLMGLGLLAAGVLLMFMNWQSALSSGTYWLHASYLAPMAICWGLSMLFARKQTKPEGTTEATAMNLGGFSGLGILLGFVNWLFISGTLSF
jgi:drug/metabolite transporter (DMT)-like permease